MTERRGARLGGVAGIIAPILWFAGMSMVDISPGPDDTAQEVVALLSQNGSALRLQGSLFGASLLALLWFLGSLRDSLLRAEGGTGRLAATAYGAGLIFVALDFLAVAVFPGLLAYDVFIEKADPEVVRTWFQIVRGSEPGLWETVAVGSTFPLVALFAAVAGVVIRAGGLPKWLGWFAAVLAVAFAISTLETLGGRIRETAGIVGFPTYFLLFRLWILLSGIALVWRAGKEPPT